jgi:hypothetical protein
MGHLAVEKYSHTGCKYYIGNSNFISCRDNYYWVQVCVVSFHFHPAASHCAFVEGGPAIAKGVEAANRMPAMRAPRTNLAVICNSIFEQSTSKRFVAVTGSAGEPYDSRAASRSVTALRTGSTHVDAT